MVIPEDRVREAQASRRELISDLYSLGEQFDPIAHSFLLTEVIKSADVRVSRRPGIPLTREQYIANVQQRIEDRFQRN